MSWTKPLRPFPVSLKEGRATGVDTAPTEGREVEGTSDHFSAPASLGQGCALK